MNIIIHRYNSICEPDFIDAFKSLGIDVIEDCAEMTDKNLPLDTRVATLTELVLVNHPMFVFTINFFPYISMICERLGVVYACVSVDCPVVELYSTMIRNKCNRIFLFDYQQYLDIHDENPECIFHMPLGVNIQRLDRTIGEPDWDGLAGIGSSHKEYKYDVSFIGSLYREKNKYPEMYKKLPDRYKGMCDGLLDVQRLMNGQQLLEQSITNELVEVIKNTAGDFYPSDMSIHNIDKFVAVNDYLSLEMTVRDREDLLSGIDTASGHEKRLHVFTRSDVKALRKRAPGIEFHGGVRSLDEMPMVFRQSRINLNPTMRSIQMGLPQRIWDVLGAGGFLLTNYQVEIPEYFEIGKHLEVYESVEEACEKIEYYLAHEDERIEIARAGYELVKEKHTVIARVVEMIKIISSSLQ